MLDVEPPPELSVFPEFDPPIDELEPEAWLLSDEAEDVAAMGAETLFGCVELGSGRVRVTA